MWNLRAFSDKIAVIEDNGRQTTYADLADYCKALTDKIPSRSLVFNLCSNNLGSLVGYVGLLEARIVPLMLDVHIDAALLKHFFEVYKPDYLWVPEERAGDFVGKAVFSELGYVLVKCTESRTYQIYDELALLLTTSGSTGSPKFVRQSYKNIASNTRAIVEYLHLSSSERPITTLPMNYTYGLSIINSHLAVGATLLLTDKTLMQRDFWDFMAKEQATSFGGVPYTYEMLNKLMFFRRQLPYLKTMTQAGGKLQPELHKKFAEYARLTGKNFVVMYGQAEATARIAYLPPERSLEKCGSMGIVIPGGKLKLIDDEGRPVTMPDTVGELFYEGDNVTLGYAECGEDLAKGDERHGILATGDMAKFDKDGFYFVVGRKKRFLKIFGNRVGLDETERLLKSMYNGMECACAGKDDAMYVFVTEEEKCAEIRKSLAEKTKLNPVAFRVKYLSEIPKNDVGKIMYRELEKYYD